MATIEQNEQTEAVKKPADATVPNTWEAIENVRGLMNDIVTGDQVPLATLDDIRDWFSNLWGKEDLDRIFAFTSTSRYRVYQNFSSKWNRNPERKFQFPETLNKLYNLVTGKSWEGRNCKFPDIFGILDPERLYKRYMTSEELGAWYKTPDRQGKTGRDYILLAIPDNFYNAWHSIAMKINTRRKQDGLPMIQESPMGIMQAMIRGTNSDTKTMTTILNMLIAFGEDESEMRNIIPDTKTLSWLPLIWEVPKGFRSFFRLGESLLWLVPKRLNWRQQKTCRHLESHPNTFVPVLKSNTTRVWMCYWDWNRDTQPEGTFMWPIKESLPSVMSAWKVRTHDTNVQKVLIELLRNTLDHGNGKSVILIYQDAEQYIFTYREGGTGIFGSEYAKWLEAEGHTPFDPEKSSKKGNGINRGMGFDTILNPGNNFGLTLFDGGKEIWKDEKGELEMKSTDHLVPGLLYVRRQKMS